MATRVCACMCVRVCVFEYAQLGSSPLFKKVGLNNEDILCIKVY